MGAKTVIETLAVPKGRRILAVSDIHGNVRLLKRLLDRSCFGSGDVLVIVGDMIDKGPESLTTLRYCMALCEKGNAYATLGNVELYRMEMLADDTTGGNRNFIDYVKDAAARWGGSLFGDMLEEAGLDYRMLSPENVMAYKECIRSEYHKEWDFLRTRAVILEAGNYLFVHGGIPTDHLAELEADNAWPYLKMDSFMDKGYCFDRYVVVGHWPVCLYREDMNSNPFINEKQHIISIDGGCGLKQEGQLNLLLLPDAYSSVEELDWIYEDGCPRARLLEPQIKRPAKVRIHWTDNRVDIVEKHGDTCVVRRVSDGACLTAPVSYLYAPDRCEDTSDAWIGGKPGEVVTVLTRTAEGYIVRKNGSTGWYYGELEIECG